MERQIWQKYRDRGLVVLGVNAGERNDPEKNARDFVTKHGVTYGTLMDTQDELSELYRVQVLPTIAIIDREGVLRYLQAGFDLEIVTAEVEKLLK